MNSKLYVSIVTGILGLFSTFISNAQGMAVNTTGSSANSSAMMDVSSTDKGILIPRMTETQRDAISSPATGLMIFQTDGTSGFYYYSGSAWTAIGGGGGAPSGAAGGSLTGTYPNPTLAAGSVNNAALATNSITTSKVVDGTVTSAKIFDNSITNVDVNNSAAIAYSKLSLSNSIVSGDLTAASVTVAKISATGTASATTYLRGDGSWSTPAGGGSTATGASPSKIPFSLSGNTTITSGTPVYSPTNSVQQATMGNSGTIVVVAPTACTPTMTITSFLGVGMTWNLYSVTPNVSTSTFTLGTLLGSCTTTAASGTTPEVCVINASAVAAGTLITLSNTAVAGTNYAFYKAFSCD